MRELLHRGWKTLKACIFFGLLTLTIYQEGPSPGTVETQIKRMIAREDFDYLSWEIGAVYAKSGQASVPAHAYLPEPERKAAVLQYFDMVRQANEHDYRIAEIYGDPNQADSDTGLAYHRAEYRRLRAELGQMQSVVEGILEDQVSTLLAEQGFALGGQVVPPVKFRFTPLPSQLIVSPRDEIRRMQEFSLAAGFGVDQAEALEDEIDRRFEVSSLVVPIGGIGIYPTMLLESDALDWVVSVIAHEWAHNWLTMFPLGWNYGTSAELRTMNETAASLVEKEIGAQVLARFYPERVPPPEPATPPSSAPAEPEPERFSFQHEMRQTRVEVDRLLAEGKVAEAEAYMEARRMVFWEHGYHIRKLNQAYFAFHGAYASEAGASGEDPVGPAVVELRQRSPSLKAFLLKLAPMSSFAELKRALGQ
ncbi:MAG: hypothetical protein JW850_00595 [Thermoflexales bacterium]|nr:hypothetical protein [Thermoflexales bacterium]